MLSIVIAIALTLIILKVLGFVFLVIMSKIDDA